MENWKGWLEVWYKEQVEVRHMLHRNPELPYEERETTRFLKQQLKDWGIQVEELPGLETGVSAVIEGAHPGPMLVLREDPEHNGFQDITDFVRDLKLKVDYGYYEDGWMDEHASLTVMAGEEGIIDLEIMYPGIMSGGEMITITKDQEEPLKLPLHFSVVDARRTASPWQLVHLTFDYNFYMQNAMEQRGEDRLAAIVHISAE